MRLKVISKKEEAGGRLFFREPGILALKLTDCKSRKTTPRCASATTCQCCHVPVPWVTLAMASREMGHLKQALMIELDPRSGQL